jgi:hypothetical protein
MKTVDNSLSVKRDITELLQLMEWIATSLITSRYIMDFTVHDSRYRFHPHECRKTVYPAGLQIGNTYLRDG